MDVNHGAGGGADQSAPGRLELSLVTTDGVELRAGWLRRAGARGAVVVAHGFSARQDEPAVARLAADLAAAGFDVLTYDARGHGRSGGESGVGSTEHLDVAAAAAEAVGTGLPVVLVGVSMGAVAVVAHLSHVPRRVDDGVVGAVLVSGPARWRMRPGPVGLASAALTRTGPGRRLAARWLGVRVARGWRTGEPPESMMRRVAVPVAVVHGARDRLLAPAHGRRLHQAAGGEAQLEVVVGMGHGLDEASRRAVVGAVEWVLRQAVATPPAQPAGGSRS